MQMKERGAETKKRANIQRETVRTRAKYGDDICGESN